jgi:glycosyltransferase involved in cell wall biosynthesis
MQNHTILLITDTYWPIQGGVEEAVRTIASALPPPFEPVIVTHAGPRSYGRSLFANAAPLPFSGYADPAGRRVVPLLPSATGRVWLLALRAWDLPGIREKHAPRIFDLLYWFYRKAYLSNLLNCISKASAVHCFSTGYLSRCTAEACVRLAVPLIQNPYIHFGKWGDSPGQCAAYAAGDAVICPTAHFKKQFHDLMGTRCRNVEIVPPVIREPDGAPVPPAVAIAERFVLFLGRREPHKGIKMLLDALSTIKIDIQIVAAGPASEQPMRHDRVLDLGLVEEPVKQWLLDNCAFLCVPSEDETFGMVYAEAMRSGKPVVAIGIPALCELVEDGVTGLLVPPGNSAALAAAITRIIADPELRKRMGEAARKRFEEKYAGKKSMGRIVALYYQVLSKKEMKTQT